MNELIQLTASQARTALLDLEITPIELVDAAAERIAALEPAIHALPTLCLDRARAHARRIAVGKPSSNQAWLGGLPLVIKETTDVAGVRTTYCSPLYHDRVPASSHPLVTRIEAQGGIVLGKSNMPEFAHGGSSRNELFEATRNPWNTDLTAGGSSGGSAAAVATGEAWLAQGTDLGGSLRQPASYCAVVGMRPSPGLVTRGATDSLWSPLSLNGPLARNVPDLALLLDAMAGLCPCDPMTFDVPAGLFVAAVRSPTAPRRIAFTADFAGAAATDRETRAICGAAALRFESLGCIVEEAAPDASGAADALAVLRGQHLLIHREHDAAEHPALIAPRIMKELENAFRRTPAEIARAERERAAFHRRLIDFFNVYDLLITPTVATPAFDAVLDHPLEIDGKPLSSYAAIGLSHTGAITLGSLPAVSVPCGFDAQGRPIGLQIVGPPRSDARVLAAAALFEELAGIGKLLPIDPRSGRGFSPQECPASDRRGEDKLRNPRR